MALGAESDTVSLTITGAVGGTLLDESGPIR